jgi:hypothetical protein
VPLCGSVLAALWWATPQAAGTPPPSDMAEPPPY